MPVLQTTTDASDRYQSGSHTLYVGGPVIIPVHCRLAQRKVKKNSDALVYTGKKTCDVFLVLSKQTLLQQSALPLGQQQAEIPDDCAIKLQRVHVTSSAVIVCRRTSIRVAYQQVSSVAC